MQRNVGYRTAARAQESSRRKKFQRNCFSIGIFFISIFKGPTALRRARFSLREDVITFSGLIHLTPD
jgi:hypothetical protein